MNMPHFMVNIADVTLQDSALGLFVNFALMKVQIIMLHFTVDIADGTLFDIVLGLVVSFSLMTVQQHAALYCEYH